MVYSNRFVMCVLVDGVPQKELANGVVKLPFGQEYHLRFRNKNNRRAVVKIYIDGENVSGSGYVVPANDYVDIKRHHDVDRTFKFVSLESPEAVEHGKNGPNEDKVKGTIEARFWLEQERQVPTEVHHHHHHHPWKPPITLPIQPYYSSSMPQNTYGDCMYKGGVVRDSSPEYSATTMPAKSSSRQHTNCAGSLLRRASNQELALQDGCTVEGRESGQRFTTTTVELEDTFTSVKVFLQGYQSERQEEVSKLSDHDGKGKYCSNCGAKIAKETANFCHICGTKL